MYDHGFMDNTNRQAVCKSQKKILWVIHKQQKNYIENQVSVCMVYDFNSIIL